MEHSITADDLEPRRSWRNLCGLRTAAQLHPHNGRAAGLAPHPMAGQFNLSASVLRFYVRLHGWPPPAAGGRRCQTKGI